MALYRLRKWITPSINGNKINRNVFKALYLEQNGMMAGIYRVMDMLSLSSLSFYFVSLPLLHSPPSLALSPTESGWPGMSSPTDGTASHSQTGAVSQGSTTGSISTLLKFMGTFEKHSFQKLIGDYFLSQCWSQWKVHECSSQINQLGVMHCCVFFTWPHQQLSLAWKGQSII